MSGTGTSGSETSGAAGGKNDAPPLFRAPVASRPSPAEIASWVGGTLLDAAGAPGALAGIGTLDEAAPDELAFVASPKYLKAARASRAGLLLVAAGADLPGRARVEVPHVWTAVAELLHRLYPQPRPEPGVHPSAVLGEGVKLGRGVHVGPHCTIGDRVVLEDGVSLGPGVTIDADCRVGAGSRLRANVVLQGLVDLGRNVQIHPGVVIGADGFRFEPGPAGILKIAQVGKVVVEDDVEIGANTCIDRPFLYETRIGRGTKIDNLVQIGHNVRIGRNCIVAGCTGLSGSIVIEDQCIIGGAASFREGITIGKGSLVGGFSAVDKSFPPGSIIAGVPARPHRETFTVLAHLQRLPGLVRRVDALERAAGRAVPSNESESSEPRG